MALAEAGALAGQRTMTAAGLERYARAVDVGALAWKAWVRERRPVPSPLLVAAQKADAEAARYAIAIGIEARPDSTGGKPGRPPGSASAPDRVRESAPEPARITRAA